MNMKKTKQENLFREGDSLLPALYYDMVLVEYIWPILFTCLDEYANLYICSCHHADGDVARWILVRTTEEAVIDLLQNRIPIHDMFSGAEDVYLLTLSERGAQPQAVKKAARDVPENYFPTAGYDMDAEEDEFDEEIAELRERIAERASDPYETISFMEIKPLLFFYSVREQNSPDIVKVKSVLTNALKSYAYCSSSDTKWQMDSYYQARQLFNFFSARKQANISGFQENPQTEAFFWNDSAFKASIQVSARSISAR